MYAKIFKGMFDGSLRGRGDTILVFVYMLTQATKDGYVDKVFSAIRDDTGLPMDRVMAAVKELESPDPESRSPAENGARIVRVSESRTWGWMVVNYEHYRKIQNEEDRREYLRTKQAKYRAEGKSIAGDPGPASEIYEAFPLKVGRPLAIRAIQKAMDRGWSAEDLLSKTKAFAEARAGDLSFCPHPSTWFNQERYCDDPATWKRVYLAKPEQVSGVDKMSMNKELDRCIDQMRTIKATYGDHQTWATEDLDKYKKLKARRDELKKILKVVV